MNREIEYFGTNLRDYGHYFWILDGDQILRSDRWFGQIDFDPYNKWMPKEKGAVAFETTDEFSVLYIYGSCTDHRWGSYSVFFVRGSLSQADFELILLDLPIAKKMFDQMDFDVQWKFFNKVDK